MSSKLLGHILQKINYFPLCTYFYWKIGVELRINTNFGGGKAVDKDRQMDDSAPPCVRQSITALLFGSMCHNCVGGKVLRCSDTVPMNECAGECIETFEKNMRMANKKKRTSRAISRPVRGPAMKSMSPIRYIIEIWRDIENRVKQKHVNL